tara:strand:+ start:741 stop:1226 length:486 start_codon:yes stop_codon:yes gene_type:complete
MRNFSRSISLFLFLRTSENARTFTSDLENERQNLSIDSKKTEEEGKNSFVQKTASSVQRTQKSFALVSIKNSKKQQTNFTEQTERKQRKKYTKTKKSVGKALDASSLCCADLYIHRALTIKCSRHSREEGLPLRNEEDIEAFSEVVLSKTLKKKQTTTTLF